MRRTNSRTGISSGWLVLVISALIVGGLGVYLWAPWDSPTVEGRLRFYCAAGMKKPVDEVIAGYQGTFPDVEVVPTYDGSGTLVSTIEVKGGEGDLYLSADRFHMDQAKKKGLIAEVIPIAKIYPVLVVSKGTQEKLQKAGKPITGLDALTSRADLNFIRANDKGAAVGRLTKQILESEGIWEKVKNRKGETVVMATVNQVANNVAIKDNAVGVVWDITAKQFKDKLVVIDVPAFKTVHEVVSVGVLKKSKQPTQALRFARYLSASDKGLEIFKKFGYDVMPDADSWELEPELTLFAGSMLKPGIEDTVKAFEKREGVKVTRSYNGCGILVSQMRTIKEDAKHAKNFPDAYFSCDVTYLDLVQDWFEARKIISKNDMVLIVKKGNPKNIKSLADLKRKDVKIGLSHYEKAALGALTHRLLKALKYHAEMYPKYDPKTGKYAEIPENIVLFDTGHSIVNATVTGSLDVAVVYRSNARSNPDNLKQLEILDIKLPKELSDKGLATQPYAVARQSKHKYAMRRLLDQILEDQTLNRMRKLGFEIIVDTSEK